MATGERADLLGNWTEVLTTQNLASDKPMDVISRWLLIVRASVFTMTLTSALIGGLLAIGAPSADWLAFWLAVLGLVVAHAANNMINDYFDLEGGVDTDGYVRTVYAPHPILSGLISKNGLLAAIAVANLIDLAICVFLVLSRGWPVLAFALGGLFISVFYVAPPLKLKHRGLGEPGVAVVWGPLMIGGTYYVTTGTIPVWVLLASLPYALLVTTVLIGKHVDKYDSDKGKGIHTLPVLLGPEASLTLNRWLMVSFFVLVPLLVAVGALSPFTLIVLAAVPRLRETLAIYREPAPAEAPPGYPIWPLWYVAWAFRLNRQVGGLFVGGLVLAGLFSTFVG